MTLEKAREALDKLALDLEKEVTRFSEKTGILVDVAIKETEGPDSGQPISYEATVTILTL